MPLLVFCPSSSLGPLVGVRKVGLASVHRASAHAPLGAFYFTGSSARETRTTAVDGSDICPLGADGMRTTAIAWYLRRMRTPVFVLLKFASGAPLGRNSLSSHCSLEFS